MSAPTLQDINWAVWTPVWKATLLFVIKDGQALLIEKKRGFGAGKINAPGGRLEPGETPEEAAHREVREELCIDAVGTRKCGELFFQFVDGHSIHGFVFRADDCEGVPTETDEAVPLWVPLDEIPFHRMWEDDRHWVPLMLDEKRFEARFLFDGDSMLEKDVRVLAD